MYGCAINYTVFISLRLSCIIACCLSDGMKYWRSDQQQQTAPQDFYFRPVSTAADVEITSYALLSMLQGQSSGESDIHTEAQVVRWLTTQRNAYGGFSSTQVFHSCLKMTTGPCNCYKQMNNFFFIMMFEDLCVLSSLPMQFYI
jgi:A-macroglobulin TED domain